MAFLLVNLVHFRDVSYALSHVNGDLLLRALAERLDSRLRPGDCAARVGSRFPVMLDNVDEGQARERAHEIQRALEVPFALAGISYEIGAQIGIALSPQHGSEYNALLRNADVALYQANEAGVNLAVYDPARYPHTPQRLALVGDFRHAIDNRDIRLYCQPKVKPIEHYYISPPLPATELTGWTGSSPFSLPATPASH